MMPKFDPLIEVDNDVTRYFRGLGYVVTWDFGRGERWYEILKGSELVCQFDFGVPLADLYADLPFLVLGQSGNSKSNYTLNCVQRELLVELYDKMKSAPPIESVQQ